VAESDRERERPFEFGDPRVNRASGGRCGKPVGCNMTHEHCLYLRHPWKLKNVPALKDGQQP